MALLLLGGGLLVFGGLPLVYALAERRGRNGSLWGVVSTALAASALWLAASIIRHRIFHDPSIDIGYGTVLPAFLAPTLVHGSVAALALVLPAPGSARGSRFEARWLGSTPRDADDRVQLELLRTRLALVSSSDAPSVEVAYADLEESRADQECLRLAWTAPDSPRQATLLLVGGARTREGRVRTVRELARRITRARARAYRPLG